MARLAVRPPADGGGRTAVWWPWSIVAAAAGWNLVSLRALTLGVAYLDDNSVHEQMVRFATAQLRAGHLPLTSWFPFLGEGSPQFLHYQSLPAILTGLVGLAVGPDVAFRWSLYLLLSLWPISVYLSARAFGAGRPAAAASAAMAPFLVSATGVGYEQHAYVWTGFGVWTQLWASWTLPLAWGWSWRAIRDGRGYLAAILLTALTVALHFETGYLALSMLLVWPLVAGRPLVARLRRAAVLLGGSLLAAAWVIVPLVEQRRWAAVNEPLQGSGLVNGYGARQRAALAGLGAAARLRPAARRDRARGARVRVGVACLVLERRRPRPAGRARGVPAVRVRPHDVRVARRRDPGRRRPLLPPLHDGRAARRAAAGRPGSGVAGGRMRAAARSPSPTLAARPVPGGRSRRGGRGARARVASARRLRPP